MVRGGVQGWMGGRGGLWTAVVSLAVALWSLWPLWLPQYVVWYYSVSVSLPFSLMWMCPSLPGAYTHGRGEEKSKASSRGAMIRRNAWAGRKRVKPRKREGRGS